jgi:hypothetical protein
MKTALQNPSKTIKKWGGRGKLRKNNIGEVKLIKVHYKHIANIKMKPLCTINLC